MKKWIISILILLIVALIASYVFIPNKLLFSKTINLRGNSNALRRVIFDMHRWQDWWPSDSSKGKSTELTYQGFHFAIADEKISSLDIPVTSGESKIKTSLNFIAINPDSISLVWQGGMGTSYNPILRIKRYRNAKRLMESFETLLQQMLAYYDIPQNLYGADIRLESVKDSTLISTYSFSDNYPTPDIVYGLIDQLKSYTAQQEAKETGYPMLNIHKTDTAGYIVRVAIPVSKRLPTKGRMEYKWMLGGGRILVTDVTGGPWTIAHRLTQVETYISENNLNVPAISYQSLITDRRAEPDTAKWVTRIYYPIM